MFQIMIDILLFEILEFSSLSSHKFLHECVLFEQLEAFSFSSFFEAEMLVVRWKKVKNQKIIVTFIRKIAGCFSQYWNC